MANTSPSTDQWPWSPIEVFQVNITPASVDRYEDNGGRHTREVRIGTMARNYARAYAERLKRSIGYYNQVKNAPNLFTIVIGVWKSTHYGSDIMTKGGGTAKGDDLDYETLFGFLQKGVDGKNFDPLRLVRENHGKIEKEIGHAVMTLYNSGFDGASLNRTKFKCVLNSIAEKHYERVQNYISGGEAPKLSGKTLYFRDLKGIDSETPLVATGQLLNAIKFEVYVEQTPEFRHHAELQAKELQRQSSVIKERQRVEAITKEAITKPKRVTADIKIDSKLVGGITKLVHVRKAEETYRPKELTRQEALNAEMRRKKNAVRNLQKQNQEYIELVKQYTAKYWQSDDVSLEIRMRSWTSSERASVNSKAKLIKNAIPYANAAIKWIKDNGGEINELN